MKRKRELAQLAEKEGLTNVAVIETRGNHLRIEGQHLGKPVKIVTSMTPSCYRTDLNLRAYIRRSMRAVAKSASG
jgi:hypothetical protein